jgi:hypothetical protein
MILGNQQFSMYEIKTTEIAKRILDSRMETFLAFFQICHLEVKPNLAFRDSKL